MDTHTQAAEIIGEKLPFINTEEYWKLDAPICAECFTGGFIYDVIKENAGLNDHHSCNELSKAIIDKSLLTES
jgi:hypothetical protein